MNKQHLNNVLSTDTAFSVVYTYKEKKLGGATPFLLKFVYLVKKVTKWYCRATAEYLRSASEAGELVSEYCKRVCDI